MRKIQISLSFLLLLIVSLFYTQPYLLAAVATIDINSVSDCNCLFDEALKDGDWEKAAVSAKQIIATEPNSVKAQDAYLWLGLYNKSKYDFSKSTEYYQKAAERFPGTWTSAEAFARLGCNYYKLNDFTGALDYFRIAGLEAKTWQQRKYASSWSKWVHFALAGNAQQLVTNCATKSINYYLDTNGIKLDKSKLASSLTLKDGLVPLSDILKFLEKEDVELDAIKCSLGKLKELQLPVIAVVKPSHLIVIKAIEKDTAKDLTTIRVYDPVLGEISYYDKELANIWEEKVVTNLSSSDIKFASLTKNELNNVLLGTCYCCPQQPITEDCEESDDDSRRGETGPGGPGGCATGGCVISYGFPRITVDTSSLALIIRDTPIGYDTTVGEDVKVSMTFNSDLAHSGIFGNSWHSNLEGNITENEDSSVTVRRSGGHDATFTYSGGQYNPPVGVSNKLVKNPDGTFTLKFTKSHRKYHYNSDINGGKLLSIEDRNGNTLSYQYDAGNNITSITDAVGRVTDIQTDAAGRITKVIDPLSREAAFTYDASGNLTQVVDLAGNIFTYVYDNHNNITSLTEPKGTYTITYDEYYYTFLEIWVSSIIDPESNVYQYSGESPTREIDPRGNSSYYYADWVSSYPFYGDTKQVEDVLGNSVLYTYDNDRNKTEVIDRRGHMTQYSYDTNHNVTSKTDPLGNQWTNTYDASNNLTSITDPRGKIATYVYDSKNNLLSVTEKKPDLTVLSVISHTYDSKGLKDTFTDARGKITDYDYDTNGNLTKVTYPGGKVIDFTYDTIGRKLTETTGGKTISYVYDDLNRITKITHPDTTYIQYTYNCCGLSQKRDENGKITSYEYDSLGRLTKAADAEGNETDYAYDGVGNLSSLTDAELNATNYTYDALNRVSTITYPKGDSESYTYDKEGNMLTKTDGKGQVSNYNYDENNRLIQIGY